MTGRNKALVRCLTLMRVLSGGRRANLQQLAAEFHVHQRTIRRDFQALEAAGVPVGHTPESDIGVAGLWWISSTKKCRL